STGALTQVSGSPFAAGTEPKSVAFSPGGGYLATAGRFSNDVSMFSVNGSGELQQVTGSPFATGVGPQSVAFSPSGGYLATAGGYGEESSSTNAVSVFSVNG